MKVKLNALERLVAQNVLPKEQNYLNMRAVKKANETLDLTEEEIKKYILPPPKDAPPSSTIQFTKEGVSIETEIELGEIAYGLLKIALKSLNEQSKLKPEYLTLYEKIVEAKEA